MVSGLRSPIHDATLFENTIRMLSVNPVLTAIAISPASLCVQIHVIDFLGK